MQKANRTSALLGLAAAALAAGCGGLRFFLANAPAAFGAHERIADLAYGSEPRQRLDIYKPAAPANARPVVVFFYGGSWTQGRKRDYRFVGATLAKNGFVAVIPDYRLHPDVRFPAFIEDGARTVAWVEAHARDYGGDPGRIVLLGHSAGAHIAAYLALDDRRLTAVDARPDAIRGFIGLAGPYALEPNSLVLNTIFADPYGPEDWQPVRFVDASAPPTLLVHGRADRTVALRHTEAMRDALENAGVPVETELYDGASHTDLVAAFAPLASGRLPVVERVTRFIESVASGPELDR